MTTPAWWSLVSAPPTPAPRALSAGGAAGGPGEVEATIRRIAQARGFSDPDLLVATARQESSLNPFAIGDQGNSRGVFQENVRGRGAGLRPEQSFDVEAATARAIDEFSAIRQRFPDVDPGTWAARAQRPADPVGYARSVNALLQQRGPADAPAPAPPSPQTSQGAGAPAWWGLVSDSPQPARVSQPRPAPEARTEADGRAVFPVAGYTGKVELHHGSEKGLGGSDLFAPEGTPVLAMVPGTVQWASTNDSLGGNNVGIVGDDGLTYYYAHFKNAPLVKPGQRVGAGTPIGDVGRSGNAASTPSHLHLGIGRGIQTGAGAQGGLGRDFDAVGYLRRTLAGAAPGHRDAPAVGDLTSNLTPSGASAAPAPAWWSLVR